MRVHDAGDEYYDSIRNGTAGEVPDDAPVNTPTPSNGVRRKKKRKVKSRRKPAKPLETTLFVRCPICNGVDPDPDRAANCLCDFGYVGTGFTQERYDKLIKENDKLLVAFDDTLRKTVPSIRIAVLLSAGYTEKDVEDAKSRL